MGSEHSQIPGIDIEEKVIEVSDFWSQYCACIDNNVNITLFIGDLFANEPFWSANSALEKFSKNLMLYRHPCIIKYISSWHKGTKYYLAVEEVRPLSHVISKMNTMEICLGLHSVLKALCFLHEKAMVSHNNICYTSIFINREGGWKLGGMEYLCRFKDLSAEFLIKSRSYRYSKAIDTNEDKHIKHSKTPKDFLDVYAFCILVRDVFKNREEDKLGDIYNVTVFKEFCKNIVQNSDISQRPSLKNLLEHEFFKQKFINIHSYLIELPLKSEQEKTEFFTTLKQELETFDENVIACQLGDLLVSRMVLINETARKHFLPFLLVPRKENSDALFSEDTFRQHISPKLLKIFSVRDAQIRLTLLEYLPHFFNCFSKHDLQMYILPELLLGIKDTNDDLVSRTLHILADLVPILGAETVIGGKRANLFKDNRPKTHELPTLRKNSRNFKQENIVSEIINSNVDQLSLTSSMVELMQSQNELPERPRPDGEEGESSAEDIEQSIEEENDNWEDWDNPEEVNETNSDKGNADSDISGTEINLEPMDSHLPLRVSKPKKLLDINELDIKNQTTKSEEQNDMDFFQDMEPVIQTNNKYLLEDIEEKDLSVDSKLCANDNGNEDGWGDGWE